MKKLILYLFLALSAQLPAQLQLMFTADTYAGVKNPHDFDSLSYWFAADIGVLDSVGSPIANDDGVGTWPDLSGNGHHVTQGTTANRPTWKLNGGPNNRPSVSFDGTNDVLVSAAHWWGSDDLTVFVVMKFGNATRNVVETYATRNNEDDTKFQWAAQGRNTTNAYELRLIKSRDGGLTNRVDYRDGAKEATYRLLTWAGSGTSVTLHKDGASQAITRAASGTGNDTIFDTADSRFIIGANRPTPTAALSGSISEIIVYSRNLTAGERESIEAYLNQKYKLY